MGNFFFICLRQDITILPGPDFTILQLNLPTAGFIGIHHRAWLNNLSNSTLAYFSNSKKDFILNSKCKKKLFDPSTAC